MMSNYLDYKLQKQNICVVKNPFIEAMKIFL